MKVFLQCNNYSYSRLYIVDVERETKTLYILKNGSRFRKTKDCFNGSIAVSVNNTRWTPANHLYDINDENIIERHKEQIFKELELNLKNEISVKLKHLEYGQLLKIMNVFKED